MNISENNKSTEDDKILVRDLSPAIFNIRKNILVVEDEAVNREMLGFLLKEEYNVINAADGIEALEQIQAHKEDLGLVLLDLLMPRMNGLEVLKHMMADENLRNIPVIVLTADQKSEVECLKLGAMDFIPKPYPPGEIILARINKCIELSETRDTIQSTERDSLTNLYNVDYFMRYVRMFDRHYPDLPMDAVMIDVNKFHMINERYGKQYGDTVLKSIGEKIYVLAREIGGVGCRQGADTFLLYCPSREDYEEIIRTINDEISGEETSSGKRIRLRMGVYSHVDKGMDIERRYDRARMAGDRVKNDLVRSVGYYDSAMHESALYRERLLEDFHPSLENGNFTVFYQPKYDIRPDKPILCSGEALVRWIHPEFGMISPAIFIPLLEESGLILELDAFVWRETAKRIRSWKDRFGYSVPISVNVSRVDMLAPNLKGILTEILDSYNLTSEDIMLEITESAYTDDSEQVITTARELQKKDRNMGFRIEMDDFGTGYSSLGMLTHLPIDVLKLDMSFVRNAFGETRDVGIIELIINIADYIHVPVVAEGVETEEQLLVLKALGCDLVQGYYFSKPVPGDEFERFLIERGAQSREVTQEAKKTCISLSKAMNNDFENIFYIDALTGYYLEFYSVDGKELQVRPGSKDFFTDVKNKLLADVAREDADRVAAALTRENLMGESEESRSFIMSFGKETGDNTERYCLQRIPTRPSDDHHILVGIRRESL